MASVHSDLLDVVVIGGGWSGILICKYAKEHGLKVAVLEQRKNIGGVWCFSENPAVTTVMKTTKTSSSATTTEMSDFPMPDKIGEFPKHDDIYKYLNSYVEHFKLKDHFRFNCKVKCVRKYDTSWNIEVEDGQIYRSKNIAVCSGIHQRPDFTAKESLLKDFTGTINHSGEFKDFQEEHRGKKVLIIGGGETASDILDAWYPHCEQIIWCIPRGQHFFRKYAKLLPNRKPQALDKASSRALKLVSPHAKSKPGLAWVCKWTTMGSLLAYQGHGIPEFRNNAAFFHSFINKHAHVLDFIDYQRVIPKGAIASAKGKEIEFVDGDTLEADHIILCSGYITEFPFLPSNLQSVQFRENYKFVFSHEDPSLAFIGFVRPIVGSIPSIAEMQAQWVAKVWSNKIPLSDSKTRALEIKEDAKFWSNYFKNTSQRLQTLVEGYTYLDDIAKISCVYPDYWSLFKHSPRDGFTAYFAPYNGCSYRLNEPDMQIQAMETLRRHSHNTITPLNLLLNLFLRVIWFDWFLDQVSLMKYWCQTNSLLQKLGNSRLGRAIDYLWTTPKRYLFDNVTGHESQPDNMNCT
ncbi:4-hydroxybenzoate brominase (decarboxylating)-like [Rhopilema esculentum]|uniref:4-hydroxybenzoate brominase (decarboxylating)-like n=1 Tax=Rhopilema esculentum TaxID=499914 RepID=UPI0031D89212